MKALGARRGLGKPETFKFLGFVLICGKSRRGSFLIKRKSRRDRARLQPRQFPAHARDAGADQALVADDLEGQSDQDRREGGELRPLHHLPNGEVGIARQMFQEILQLIAELRPQPPPALA